MPINSCSNKTVLVHMPSPDYIVQEELDVDLPPKENVRLIITDRAADVCVLVRYCGRHFTRFSATAYNIDPHS